MRLVGEVLDKISDRKILGITSTSTSTSTRDGCVMNTSSCELGVL